MIDGLRAVVGGIGFVLFTPAVWAHAVVPVLVVMLLGCGLAGVGIYGAGWGTWALVGEPEGVWGHIGGWLLAALAALTALLLAFVLALILAQPVSGFALERIVLAQERALLGRNVPHSSLWQALWTSTRATLLMLVVGGVIYTLLFVIDLCFAPALLVTAPLRLLVGGWLLAWNFLDYPLSLRGLGVWARLGWSARHWEECTVFGLAWATLLFVPGLFFVVLPMGVAGATRLVIEAERITDGEVEEYDD